MEEKIKGWIARDKNRKLYAYVEKPKCDYGAWCARDKKGYLQINKNKFPNLTFENSP